MSTLPPPAPTTSKWTLILEIAQIALGALGAAVPGLGVAVNLGEALIRITQKAQAAYVLHEGAPMDPSLITPEAPVV